jgi:hypothetical protein
MRHANLTYDDDATLDIRGASIKFADSDNDSPLDILYDCSFNLPSLHALCRMNTGSISAFWNLKSFEDFFNGVRVGKEGLQKFLRNYPAAYKAASVSLRYVTSIAGPMLTANSGELHRLMLPCHIMLKLCSLSK